MRTWSGQIGLVQDARRLTASIAQAHIACWGKCFLHLTTQAKRARRAIKPSQCPNKLVPSQTHSKDRCIWQMVPDLSSDQAYAQSLGNTCYRSCCARPEISSACGQQFARLTVPVRVPAYQDVCGKQYQRWAAVAGVRAHQDLTIRNRTRCHRLCWCEMCWHNKGLGISSLQQKPLSMSHCGP